jgi:hypothetical protein
MLFPVTPYFEEFYNMRKKYENKKTTVYMSEEAFKYRVEALTDNRGRFKFEKLKPGKYYLETIVNFTATASYQNRPEQQMPITAKIICILLLYTIHFSMAMMQPTGK